MNEIKFVAHTHVSSNACECVYKFKYALHTFAYIYIYTKRICSRSRDEEKKQIWFVSFMKKRKREKGRKKENDKVTK